MAGHGCARMPVPRPGAGVPCKVIDSHTHFYDPTRPQGVPWPERSDSLLYRKVLPADYRALAQPLAVTGTVVIEASSWVEDNQWILDLAAADPFIVAFIGNLPVGASSFRPLLERFARNPLFRGLRVSGRAVMEGTNNGEFLAHLAELAERGLSLDVLGGPEGLLSVDQVARRIPGLRIILDHLAGVRINGETPSSEWREAMTRIAQRPNLFCKASGLVEATGVAGRTAPGDVNYYRPTLEFVWDRFGEERLVYGSNWPVSERFAEVAQVQQIVRQFVSEKGDAAADRFFWQNARTVYRWVDRI